ncbi:putative cyclase [Phlebopus sp. FC_14]|nr:putative cyclase [Phlebopus sp. FC_14]
MIDLSHTLASTGMSTWPGHPVFSSYNTESIPESRSNVTALSFGSHTGTHLDAPSHFMADGQSVDALDIGRLFGPAVVVDVRTKGPRERIAWDDMKKYEGEMREGVIVLICTGWSRFWGKENYGDHPFLDVDAARELVARGIRVIGLDALSPDEMKVGAAASDCGSGVHGVILGAGGAIAENLCRLDEVLHLAKPVVSLLPLKIGGCDGSPIRAVAFDVSESELQCDPLTLMRRTGDSGRAVLDWKTETELGHMYEPPTNSCP